MNPPQSSSAAANNTTTTSTSLRPRTRRLISIESDSGVGDENQTNTTQAISSSNSLRDAVDSAFSNTRRPSPRPSAHPSRGSSATRTSPYNGLGGGKRSFGLEIPTSADAARSASPSRRGKSSSLWSSPWSSLQGVASTFLGSNINEPNTPVTPGGGSYAKRKERHGRNYSLSVPDEPWGPSGKPEDLLATGSQEDRLARVQAEKRKVLLSGIGDEQRDIMGRYKRRTSLDRADSIPSPTHDDDALIYIHRVMPTDSVAGLSIRYNCAQAVVRKANRLYPSDSIQLRKVAYLPVDACSVRGRKVPGPGQTNLELLAGTDDTAAKSSKGTPNGVDADYHIATSPEPSINAALTPSDAGTNTPSDSKRAWIHDSWVQLPRSSGPTEIGRLPRRTLGFFPPARRKSITSAAYTDSSPPRSITSGTPPPNAVPALSTTMSANTSPARTKSPGRPPIGRLSRSSSTASKLNPHTRQAASLFLRGPGGVGSLHSSVHGPAPDELNRFVAMHMPQLIIEGAIDGGGGGGGGGIRGISSSRQRASSGTHRPSVGISGPRISFDRVSVASGGSSTGAGVEAMAGAVEGWMRKVGGRVKETLGTPEMRGRGGGGDLIELVEGWDLNGAEGGGGEGIGFSASPLQQQRDRDSARDTSGMSDSWESQGHGVMDDGTAGFSNNGSVSGGTVAAAAAAAGNEASGGASGKGKGRASARENEEERLLRERFPPAGRVFEEQQSAARRRA